MKVHIVCYEDVNGWILGKISLRLAENLEKQSHTCSISKVPDPSADINHHVCYFDYDGARSSIDTVMITHIDTPWKLERVKMQMKNARMGICFSSETVARLARQGVPRSKLCHVLPAHDEVMAPRPIVVGLTSKIHDDARKRESMLVTLADYLSPAEFAFKIMGAGWERIVAALRGKGFKVEYHDRFDYELNKVFVPSLDYYLYFGMDEGAMGFIDAVAAGVPTIVTPQGYHLDVEDGITHPFVTLEDLVHAFDEIAAVRRKRVASVADWTWKNYAIKHAEVWDQLLERSRNPFATLPASRFPDGVGSMVPEPAPGPLSVLLLYDVEGWAWWHRARQIRQHSPAGIRVDIARLGEAVDFGLYDFVVVFDPYLLGNLGALPPEKIVAGCSCPKYLGQSIALLEQKRCAAIFVNNRDMYRSVERFPNAFCCQNGVDTELFHPAEGFPAAFTACWVGNSGSVGNKGFDLIQDACKATGTELLVLDREANRDRGSLYSQAEIRDRIYHKATVYLCASELEGTPNPALEALACGLPVISTRVGNMPELIRDGVNGFLVERSAAALADALVKLKGMDPATLRRNARRSVEDGWSWQDRTKRYEDMFNALGRARERQAGEAAKRVNAEGEERFNAGDIAAATDRYREAIRIAPGFATPYSNLGVVAWMAGDAREALKLLLQALALDPDARETILNIGAVLKGVDLHEDARHTYAAYLQAHPRDHEIAALLKELGG